MIVGARSFPGNPYDGDTLAEQLEQAHTLMQDVAAEPQVAIGLPMSGGGGHTEPAPGQGQVADAPAMALDQAPAGSGTGDRTSEAGAPAGPPLAQGRPRRCVERDRRGCRLQPALADALDRAFACLAQGDHAAANGEIISSRCGRNLLKGILQIRLTRMF